MRETGGKAAGVVGQVGARYSEMLSRAARQDMVRKGGLALDLGRWIREGNWRRWLDAAEWRNWYQYGQWKKCFELTAWRAKLAESGGRTVALVGVTLILGITCLVVASQFTASARPTAQVYFVNDRTLEVTLQSGRLYPPVSRPDGDLVWAFYYSCDGCRTKTLGFLQKYSLEAKGRLEDAAAKNGGRPSIGAVMGELGELWVRAPVPGAQWCKARSPEGIKVTSAPNCGAGHERDYSPCIAADAR